MALDLFIRGGTVVSPQGRTRAHVGIQDGRIAAITLEEHEAHQVIDAEGMYAIPGLVEMHAHLERPGGPGLNAEYQYRLYLGHGVTTVRDAGTGAGLEVMREQRRLAAANEIVAPRLILCQRWPLPLRRWDVGHTPEDARRVVREMKELGADCIKISRSPGHYPDVMEAATAAGKQLGMHVVTDLKVSESDAVVASNAGVASIEHWYGVPDAALPHTQNFPPDYNYWDELDRFRWAGALWQEADQYPDRLTQALQIFIDNGTAWNPTMAVYEGMRERQRVRIQPWTETLGLGTYEEALPDPGRHGGYASEWKTSDEVMWKENFRIWMKWIKQFHEMGGVLTAGTDVGGSGGIAIIRELELFQEAGIHPIDAIRIATTNATKTLGLEKHCGIRVGCVADLAVINGNPLDNFKVMYGRGYGFYGMVPRDQLPNKGGVIWTIKEGIVFDAQALLKEVEWYVQQIRRQRVAVTSSR